MNSSSPSKSSSSRVVGSSARRKAAISRRAAREGRGTTSSQLPLRDVDHHSSEQQKQQQFLPSSSPPASSGGKDYLQALGFSSSTTSSLSGTAASRNNNKKKSKSVPSPPPSQFSGYLYFHRASLACLLGFALCYLIVLACFWPMISMGEFDDSAYVVTSDGSPSGDSPGRQLRRGASFERVRGRKALASASQAVSHRMGNLKTHAREWEQAAQQKALSARRSVETKLGKTLGLQGIGSKDGLDAVRATALLEDAVKEFEDGWLLRTKEHEAAKQADEHWLQALEDWKQFEREEDMPTDDAYATQLKGFMVLGMHRSGTSMLAGLMVQGFGYDTGGPLIQPAFDNEKGFYERIDVVLQNDEFFQAQNMGWSYDVFEYDSDLALQHKQRGSITFREGAKAMRFLNRKHDIPYLQKDPRMCITLPTWLHLLDSPPAIVFTYRHPLEVAMSLKKRENYFTLEHGLRLWIVYNMRAIQHSSNLCRVISSNNAIIQNPSVEVQRITDELTSKCHVIPPPTTHISNTVVKDYIDVSLQHNKKRREQEESKKATLEDFGNGCIAREFDSEYPPNSSNYISEKEMYLMAMSVYCDLENGKAYEYDYEWPDLINMIRPARIS